LATNLRARWQRLLAHSNPRLQSESISCDKLRAYLYGNKPITNTSSVVNLNWLVEYIAFNPTRWDEDSDNPIQIGNPQGDVGLQKIFDDRIL